MTLFAVSKDTIRRYVIRYFHDVFHTPISAFKPSTNVRVAYSYSDRAWRRLADVFNKLSWMDALDARLSPRVMPGLNTIDDLVNAIWSSLSKIISVAGSGASLDAGAVRNFPAPKRQPASSARTSSRTKPSRKKARRKPKRKKNTNR